MYTQIFWFVTLYAAVVAYGGGATLNYWAITVIILFVLRELEFINKEH